MSALNIYNALLKAQTEFPDLRRDGENPHFHSRFVTLESLLAAVLPVLQANGLLLTQTITNIDGQPALRTSLFHAETGDAIEDTALLMVQQATPQGQGSAVTYGRRYGIQALLCLQADNDDDGEAATAPSRQQSVRAVPASASQIPDQHPSPGNPF